MGFKFVECANSLPFSCASYEREIINLRADVSLLSCLATLTKRALYPK
jgi:hypothetical protein